MSELRDRTARLSPERRAPLEQRLRELHTTDQHAFHIPRRNTDEPCPLSFSQQRLWFLDRFEPNSATYNICKALLLKGPVDKSALQKSLDRLLDRHEALRTTFHSEDGTPKQVILPSAAVELEEVNLTGKGLKPSDDEVQRLLRAEGRRGFDLSRDLMLRAKLIQLAKDEVVLFITMHHSAFDGWSMGILFRELTELYRSYAEGEQPNLPELPIQYSDYSEWHHRRLRGDLLAEQVAYWRQQLEGIPEMLQLPTDRRRPAQQIYRGSREYFVVGEQLCGALKSLSRGESSTLFMTLLATFGVLLHRYSGQDDIVIGAPIAGRNRVETEGLIGFFVNSLALRIDLSKNPSFRELLRRIRKVALEAYDHQELPFEKLVEKIQPRRSLGHPPLFQVMFSLQNVPFERLSLPGLSVEALDFHNGTAKFELTLTLTERSGELKGVLEYNSDLFHRDTARRLVHRYERLLEGVTEDLDQKISAISLVKESERRQLLEEWNRTEREYPQDRCVHELFEEQVEKTPDVVAVEWEGQQLTYRQLNEQANRLAHHLRELGVGPEVLVGLCVERSLDMVVGLLGILKAGGAYVPLDPNYPHERLAFMMADSGLEVLLSESALVGSLPEFGGRSLCLEEVWADLEGPANGAPPGAEAGADDLAYVIYTSGSTGLPKGVEITHGALTNFLRSMADAPGLMADDRLLAVTTLSFDISALELYLPLTVGASVVIASRETASDGVRLAAYLSQIGATVMQATPSTWRMLLGAGWDGDANLKILSGGEALPRGLADRLLGCGGELWNLYGPTETTIWSTAHRVAAGTGSVSVGRPIANTEVYILDAGREPVPVGVTGELFIGGAGLARGYLGRADLTAQRFVPHPFSAATGARLYRTGDLARYRPDGEIEVLGRLDHQVKLRGHRIELGEIEAVLGEQAGVEEAVVVLSDNDPADDIVGARLVAYVVPRGGESVSADELRGVVRHKLPDYMVPSFFVMLETMPRTANQKVDRRALPAPEIERLLPGANYVAPRTPTEQTLAEIWAEVLGLEQVGIHDDFFAIGGHSLLAVRLFARIKDELGMRLPLATLFSAATVSRLAAEVTGSLTESDWSCFVPIREKGTRPALYCVHGEGGEVLFYRKLAEFLGDEQPLFGLQAYGLDGINPPDTSVEAMASRYIREIRQRQADGPYYLAGHCFGGVVAFEMAHQLQAQGQQVALLAMLDGAGPPVSRTLSDSLVNLMTAVRRDPVGLVKYLVEVQAPIRLRHFAGAVLQKFARHNEQSEPETNQVELALQAIRQAIRIAYMNYEPRQYDGKIVCFVNSQRGLLKFNRWTRLASGGTETLEFVGDHRTSFEEPSVGYLADSLRQHMDRLLN